MPINLGGSSSSTRNVTTTNLQDRKITGTGAGAVAISGGKNQITNTDHGSIRAAFHNSAQNNKNSYGFLNNALNFLSERDDSAQRFKQQAISAVQNQANQVQKTANQIAARAQSSASQQLESSKTARWLIGGFAVVVMVYFISKTFARQ